MEYLPNVDTVADLIDRLIVEVNKISILENRKREESLKENPKFDLIVEWDRLSRDANELRSKLKTKLNQTLQDILKSGEYKTVKEVRTFAPSPDNLVDIVDKMCATRSSEFLSGELKLTLEYFFNLE